MKTLEQRLEALLERLRANAREYTRLQSAGATTLADDAARQTEARVIAELVGALRAQPQREVEQRVEAPERRSENFGDARASPGQHLRAVIDQVVDVIREHATPETIPAIAPALRELAPALHTGTLCGPCVATVTPPERGKPCQWCGVQGDGDE